MNVIGTIAIIVLVIGILTGILWFVNNHESEDDKRYRLRTEALDTQGLKSSATVVHIEKAITHQRTSTTTQVIWTLDVKAPDGSKYQISRNELDNRSDFLLPAEYAPTVLKVGLDVPIIIHPTESTIIILDEERLKQQTFGNKS